MPSTFGSVGSEGELSPKHGGIQRRNTNPDIDPYVKSQEHLLTATHYNPQPTAVPPPIAANAGTLGVRHVLCIIGLPERGKPYIAKRLQAYLSFFHGADVQLFNIADYQKGPAGCDENAEALLDDLRRFMDKRNTTASHNMDVPVPEGLGSVSKVHRRTPSAESRAVMTAEAESSLSARREDSVARREDSQSKRDDNMALLVDEGDRRRKNVDSGKVAIIMSTDSHITFKEKWSGTSKERRQWLAATLAADRHMGAKLIFIEVIVNQPHLIDANIRAKRRAQGLGEISPQALREHNLKVKHYSRMYVTLQDDGSEDDLSYIKLYNYGGKVVTNRMHGYLRMRIAQFLTTVHTTPHIIYLSRHGQSEYNVLGKIGGNPPLSSAGEEYSHRLGEWVPKNICTTSDGKPVKTRLWTSSLQRTILTAEHIPHPVYEAHQLYDAFGNPLVSGQEPELQGIDAWRQRPPSDLEFAPRGDSSPLPGTAPGFGAAAASATSQSAVVIPTPSSSVDSIPPAAPLPPPTIPARVPRYNSDMPPSLVESANSASGELEDFEVWDQDELWEQMSPRVYRNLDEIFAGEYEGMSYEDIKRLKPDEASLRAMDKIGYRYPRGESYFDILSRLDPLVHEMESYREPLLIVSHQAVLRVLYAYLMSKPRTTAPKIEIPLHSVMKITYDGWNPPREERFYLGPEPLAMTPGGTPDDGQKNL